MINLQGIQGMVQHGTVKIATLTFAYDKQMTCQCKINALSLFQSIHMAEKTVFSCFISPFAVSEIIILDYPEFKIF